MSHIDNCYWCFQAWRRNFLAHLFYVIESQSILSLAFLKVAKVEELKKQMGVISEYVREIISSLMTTK